ncbi:ABC transporter substrate-binding protein [Roseomonas sp. BN140053]|uniref:ABC transporter substrate-binding protein n=1 Tax=Roseomonas sp. BN140053 TaxID=3391898 RepID=UPI0039E9D62B
MTLGRRTLLAGTAATTAAFLPITSREAQAQQARTLLLAAPGTPEGFDGDALRPGTQESVTQIYEGLTRYARVERNGRTYLDPGRIEGHLAESWTTSEDGKRWVLTLREGVRSPFGNELTAADVEWGWNKSFAQKRTGAFIASAANVTAVKALSKREVEFTLSAPSSILLSALTLYTPGIYDSTEVKKHATPDDPWALKWLESNSAGFGAYQVESVLSGQQAVFTANPNYFRGQPFFSRVVYRAVPSAASRVTLLRSGQVQWIDRANVQQVTEMQKDRRVKVQDVPGRAISSVRMNCAMKPFDDVRVRRALNFALDRNKLRQAVLLGTGTDALSIVPPILQSYDPSFFAYAYDPARARALLAEAGHGGGLDLELNFSDIFWWEEPMAIQVSDQLKQVGVNARLQRITGSDMRGRSAPGRQDLPFFTFEDGPIVLDPVYSMSLMAHSNGVSNRARYKNPALDAAVDEAKVTMDPVRRDALMRDAQRIWMEDAPWLLTVYPQTFECMSPAISGWVPHPDEHERWVDLRIA